MAVTVYAAMGDVIGATLVLAHGAGAGQRSAFIVTLATELAACGVEVFTFDFPYMARGGRVPDRAPVMEASYREAIDEARRTSPGAAQSLFIGGKSMGGRMATHVAAADPALAIRGLVLYGYPLHPPGQPQKRRDAHLPSVRRPLLVVQGSRDSFGTPDELTPVFSRLTPPASLHVIEGGDHSFKASSTRPAPLAEIARVTRDWMREVKNSPGLRTQDSGLQEAVQPPR
jgi:hypothetical protein